MEKWKEAFQWLPVKIATAMVIEAVIISLVLDVWSVIVR